MSEINSDKEINALIKEHLVAYPPNVQAFCLLAIEKAQDHPVPDVIEILRTSAKDYINNETGKPQ